MRSVDTRPHITTIEKPAHHGRRVLLICLAVLFSVALAAVCVHFALTTAEQQKRIAALEETLSSQAGVLARQESALEEQSQTLQEQSKSLEANSSQMEKQQETIKNQEKKIKQQQNTISDLNKQLVAKKKTQTTAKPKTTTTKPVAKPVALPDVSHLKGKKLVALTFDDGPGPYTERLLDAMKERGVKATFFLLGSKVNRYASTIKRMEAEGHLVGNHSQSHKQLTKLSAEGIKSDMDACASKIKAVVGHEPAVMRCPYGSFNNNVRSYAAGKGIPIIQWGVDTEDWRYSSKSSASATKSILANAFKSGTYGIHDGSIVLMHDIHKNSVDAAIAMMDKLIAEGYTPVTVLELLAARESSVTSGKVYY